MRISDWSSDVCSSDLQRSDSPISIIQGIGLQVAIGGDGFQIQAAQFGIDGARKSIGLQIIEGFAVIHVLNVGRQLRKDRRSAGSRSRHATSIVGVPICFGMKCLIKGRLERRGKNRGSKNLLIKWLIIKIESATSREREGQD